MATKSSSEKPDLRAQLAEELIKRVEQGTASWQRPWDPSMGDDTPINAITGKPYRGVNRELLSTFGPADGDGRYCTYKQATEKGWQVRKGEHGYPVEKWMTYEKETVSEAPEIKGQTVKEQRIAVRYYTVFHASQIDGIPPLERPTVEKQIDPDKRIDNMLVSMGVSQANGGNRAFYRVSPDHIRMPPVSAFPTAGDYDTVRLHEASHATGHPSRLNRDLSGEFGSPKYAKEELRAEISAAMTSRVMGIAFDPDQVKATEQSRVEGVTNSAAYLASWLRSLPEKDRVKELMSAISDAQKISDHLLSHVPELQVEQKQQKERPTVSRGDYVRYADETGKEREGIVLDGAAAGDATRVRGIYRWSNGIPGMDGADHVSPVTLPPLVEHLPGAVQSGQTLDAIDPVTGAYKLTMGNNIERNKAEYAVLREIETARGVPDPHLMPVPQQTVDIQEFNRGDLFKYKDVTGRDHVGVSLRESAFDEQGGAPMRWKEIIPSANGKPVILPGDTLGRIERGNISGHVPNAVPGIEKLDFQSPDYEKDKERFPGVKAALEFRVESVMHQNGIQFQSAPEKAVGKDIQKGDYVAFRTSDGTVQEGIALGAWTDGDVVYQPTKRDRDEGDRAAVWPADARIATVEKEALLAHIPGVAEGAQMDPLNTRCTAYQKASMADITSAVNALERKIDAAMPAEKFRTLSLQHEAQIGKTRDGMSASAVVTIGTEPGQQRRWTGKVASISEDRKAIEITAMGKTQSIVDARGRPFPAEIQPGQYGKVVLDKAGNLAFEGKEKTRSRSRGVA
ncbi:MAG: ArdC family protein [Acidithiobacillus sp.]